MNDKELKETKNNIIDCLNSQSVSFGDNLINYANYTFGQAIESFDDFFKIFNNCGKFLFWSTKQILSYKKNYKEVLQKDNGLRELVLIQDFEKTKLSFKKTRMELKMPFSKLLFYLVFVSLKIRKKQLVDGYYIFAPFLMENAFKFYDLSSISKSEIALLISDLDFLKDFSILKHNLLKEEYLDKKRLVDAIKGIEKNKYLDWNHGLPSPISIEESLLVEYFSVRYEFLNGKNTLRELMNFGSPWPDVSQWTKENINKVRLYYAENNVDIITDFINYVLFNGKISPAAEAFILDAVNDFFKDPTRLITPIVSFAFHNKNIFSKSTTTKLVNSSLLATESLKNINVIENLKEAGVILHKNALKIIGNKNAVIIAKASTTNDENLFKKYLIADIFDYASFEDFKNVSKRFECFSLSSSDALLYINYMKVLGRAKEINRIDKTWLAEEIVRVVYRWQNLGFNKACSKIITHSFEGPTISFKDAESYFKAYFRDPRLPFFRELGFSEKEISKRLILISEGSFDFFVNTVVLSSDFPYMKGQNDPLDYDEKKLLDGAERFEKLLYPFFKNLISKINHRFTNNYSPFFFMREFFERYQYYVMPLYLLKQKRQRIYKSIKKKRPKFSCSSYSSKPTYSDLTQLFPLLEKEVLYTGTKFGVSPVSFTNDINFAKPVSPSEVLLKLIEMIYDSTGDLYLASDFISIFVLMYYRKNMNIRNCVVHGNNYPFPPEVIDAYYTLTLICLNDLIKRNDSIDKGKRW